MLPGTKGLLGPLLCIVWAYLIAKARAKTHAASGAHAERESTLGGMCFQSTISDEASLRTLRRQTVKFNQKKSMYRDGDVIAVYKLDRPGHGSLAGCANACLLNWRLTDDSRQALDTDCSLAENSHCPMTSGVIVADRKCEAFMFNRLTSVCTLLSVSQSLMTTQSSNFWSGKLICEDMTSVDDWAEGVVSRRSPPPPPPPSPPPPSPPPPPPFYLASNGVTVKCPDANEGDTGDVGGTLYTKRTESTVKTLVSNSQWSDVASTCTTGITDMSSMFVTTAFDEDISSWDTSSVENMEAMFAYASNFDQDISSWDTSSVTTMDYMFLGADSFNQDLSNWNGSALTNCHFFAVGATSWLNAYSGSIAGKSPPLSQTLIDAICGFHGAN